MNLLNFSTYFSKKLLTRWIAGSGLAVVFFLVAALVLAQTRMLPEKAMAPGAPAWGTPQPAFTYFAQERLKSYTGAGFNLIPELNDFLDALEQQALTSGDEGKHDQVVRQLTRFVNADFVQFDEHIIAQRENYWKLAKLHGYTIDTIVGCNPHLEKIVCYVGQKILLPSRGGCLHQVKLEETLDTLALDYRVEPGDISSANRLDPALGVVPGMWLFIPGAKPLYLSQGMHKQYTKRALLRSPLSGRYTSFVGKRIHPVLGFSKYHNGVDIACKMNSWVGASASGVVMVAGWGGAIGKYIKIDHQNGYVTMYGHLDKIYVHAGQKVRGGQLIARSGNTGRTTGPHLHYTIWENGVVKNPMDFLW